MAPVIPAQEMRTFLRLLRFQQESCRVNTVQEATENANSQEELRKGFPSQDPAPLLKGERPGGDPTRGPMWLQAPSLSGGSQAAGDMGEAAGSRSHSCVPELSPTPRRFVSAATKAVCSQVTGANLPWWPGAERDKAQPHRQAQEHKADRVPHFNTTPHGMCCSYRFPKHLPHLRLRWSQQRAAPSTHGNTRSPDVISGSEHGAAAGVSSLHNDRKA